MSPDHPHEAHTRDCLDAYPGPCVCDVVCATCAPDRGER